MSESDDQGRNARRFVATARRRSARAGAGHDDHPRPRRATAGHDRRWRSFNIPTSSLCLWAAAVLSAAVVYDLAIATRPAFAAQNRAVPQTDAAADADAEQAAGSEDVEHESPVAPVLLAIVLILLSAKIVGDLFERMGMPAVLGELLVGIILGNFAFLTGSHVFDPLFDLPAEAEAAAAGQSAEQEPSTDGRAGHAAHDRVYNTAVFLKILAGIGVVLLLFEVGLESTVREMMSVGVSSLFVALLGVVAPMLLGFGAGWLLIPEEGWQVWTFIGATLCATSVGITARVLKDLGRSQQRESQIILGAAVLDDVLGLVILTVVAGVIRQGVENFSVVSLLFVIVKALGFLIAAIALGTVIFTRPLFKAASFLRGHGLLVATSLVVCFGFAWLATLVPLEPIVGAFAAGLILERAHYRELGEKEDHTLEEALAPLTALLVPIFFVQMGTQVDLTSFTNPSVWLLAGTITVMAIIGKQVCALGVREPGLNRLAVGLGMIPRGEVGLIFAEVGRNLQVAGQPVINPETFSAVVVMVIVTTMVTPPLLKWALTRQPRASADPGEAR